MNAILVNIIKLIQIGLWCGLWGLGGIWIVRSALNLRPNEQVLAGIGAGLVIQTWLANLLGRLLPVPLAFWAAAGLTLLAGLGMSLPLKKGDWGGLFRFSIPTFQLVTLILLSFGLIVVGRGLGVLDDYQNLPTTSLLASGDIPPHFALDPNLQFDYHYFTLLSAAEFMRIAGAYPWNSLDIVRGFSFALTLILGALWIQRATGSRLAGFLGALVGAFSGGTRWLMLFLPDNVIQWISPQIHMIGSGAQSAADFGTALTAPWAVETGAKWSIPFAFSNGINVPAIWTYHAGWGGLVTVITALLLLAANRWRARGWRGPVVMVVLLAALALGNEVTLAQLIVALVFLAVVLIVVNLIRARRKGEKIAWKTLLPAGLLEWAWVLIPAGLIALVQGGVLTGAFMGLLGRLSGQAARASYFSLQFAPAWPPAVLSSHLGSLALTNPAQFIVALFEVGPLVVLLPFPLIWGWKAVRAGRWYEATLVVFPVLALVTLVINYTGNAGPTALNRIQSQIFTLTGTGIAFAALWMWLKGHSDAVKAATAGLLVVGVFGGLVLFGFEVMAAATPLRATFVTDLDARMEDHLWNRLEPGALVFDLTAWRSPTLFARATDSHSTWYSSKPEWDALTEDPDPYKLRAAGFSYVYQDNNFWNLISLKVQKAYSDPCVQVVDEAKAKRTADFRRLVDIRTCQR
jgi:hypothetical protein